MSTDRAAPEVEALSPPSLHGDEWASVLGQLRATAPARLLETVAGDTVLVVTAHPDDETFGAGATLARLALDGVHVHVVSLTAGEAAYDALGRRAPGLADRRREEFAAATATLGVQGEVLDLPDGDLASHEGRASRWVADRVAAIGATQVLSVWERDPHPDHRAAGRVARTAARRHQLPVAGFPLWAYHWSDPDDPDVAGRLLRTDPGTAARARRNRALACYPSQTRSPAPGVGPVVPAAVLAWSEECLVADDG